VPPSRHLHCTACVQVGSIFQNPLDARRTLREVAILRHLSGHCNIVGLRDLFPPPCGAARFQDVYEVFDVRMGLGVCGAGGLGAGAGEAPLSGGGVHVRRLMVWWR
jgi:hypothetical protein